MADSFGLKIGVEGEKEFKRALADINSSFKVLGSEMNLVSSQFDKQYKSIQALTARNAVLNKEIDAQKQKISTLEQALNNAAASFGENDRRTQAWQTQLNNAKAVLNGMERELEQSVIEADNLGEELDGSGQSAETASGKFEKLGGVLKGIGVAMGALAVAAGAAAIKLGKEVVKQFGELEQNLGGSEAVFGKYAASIKKTGEDAYKNMGVSQSQYLATANKMGALFQGSGIEQQKSLELTEKAMQRAADMASVVGVDMQMALDSVAGAAKGNFTMMDNLGVAMNATNIQAYALAKGLDFTWASATQAEKAEIAMQMFFENTEQYAGNFARESTETITGSLGLLKAAVGSFTAGLGSADADMTKLTQNLADAFQAVIANLIPVLENIVTSIPTALNGILTAVGELLPVLLDTVTAVFTQVLETILTLLPELIPAAVDAVMTIVGALIDNLPLLINAAVQLVTALVAGIVSALPQLIPAAVNAITTIVQGLLENLPMLLDAALQLILGFAQGMLEAIPQLIAALPEIISAIVDFLISATPQIIAAGVLLLAALVQNLPAIIAAIVKAVPQIIAALVQVFTDSIGQMVQAGDSLIQGLWQGISNAGAWLWENISSFFGDIVSRIKNFLGIHSPSTVLAEVGTNMALGLGVGFAKNMGQVEKDMENSIPTDFAATWSELTDNATSAWGKIVVEAEDIWNRLAAFFKESWQQTGDNFSTLWGGVNTSAREIWNSLSDFFLASWTDLKASFETIWYGIRDIFINIWTGLQTTAAILISGVVDNIKAAFNIDWWSVGRSIIDGITGGVMAAAQGLAQSVANAARAALDAAKSALGIRSPSTVFRDEVGLQIGAGLAEGIDNSRERLCASLNGLLNVLRMDANLNLTGLEAGVNRRTGTGTGSVGATQNITIISPKPLSERELAREFQNTSRKLAMGVL